MIDSYRFGRMVIDGKTYTKDLIIYPDRVKSPWWRESGHFLALNDIKDVFANNPETLIIGTGYWGLMKVGDEIKKQAKKKRIQLIIQNSKKAVQTFNDMHSQGRVFAAFHITC